MEGVEVPRREARAILRKTIMSVGYDRDLAEIGVWSALWLEERYRNGVTNLIVYLCLVRGRDFDSLRPRRHEEFAIAGSCPFMLASAIIDLADKWVPRGGVAFGAPGCPFLMSASLADWASQRGKALRFHHFNYSCLMSNDGVDIETNDRAMVGWIDPESEQPMSIELTDDRPEPAVRRVDTVRLPSVRLRGTDALDLS